MRGASLPWTDRETRARSGAVEALADVGGDEARAALVEVLRAPQFSKLHHPVVVFLPRIHSQESVPVLVSQLSSSNATLVIRAILGLQQLQARSAIPDLVRLLHHRNATVRLYAASALRVIADGNIQTEMRAAADDPDEAVQVPALWYLALHGDASLAPLFEARLRSSNQYIREMCRLGLQRVGTSESVANLRPLIESPSETVRRNTTLVLELITFRDMAASEPERRSYVPPTSTCGGKPTDASRDVTGRWTRSRGRARQAREHGGHRSPKGSEPSNTWMRNGIRHSL